ncbi:MAG: BamA/TamA family outer membrane protein [Bacteroidales bacterium]|nr:BamA/TamA family outer membrane protein [Bacteroidales bacterium]
MPKILTRTIFFKVLYGLIILVLCCQCAVTRHWEDHQQKLLIKHKISSDEKKVDTDEMLNYVKPKPNRAFMGFHTRLYFYYTFENATGKFGTWMRDIVGEPPVILDEGQIAKNEEQLRLYLNELGYYNASVSSSISYKGWKEKKAVARYKLTCGKQYTLSNVSYQISDSTIAAIVARTQGSSKLKKGKPFAIGLLQDEQARIVRICNNVGYYAITKNNIFFAADTTHGPDSVSLVISVKETSPTSLKKHRVHSTEINQNYMGKSNRPRHPNAEESKPEDTKTTNATHVKDETIQQANFIEEGRQYSLFRVERTQRILTSYPLFKLVNIEFKQSEFQSSADTIDLDCQINITPEKRQSISVDVEGTNTSGDWGAALNTSYKNRNVFHGAEFLNLKLKLAGEYNNVLKEEDEDIRLFNSLEYGIAVDLTTPKFLTPINLRSYNKRFRAKTNCHLEYNFLQTPDYTRPTTEINFGYTWYGRRFLTYNLNPIDISYIRYYNISDRFNNFINSKNYYKYSYEDYLLYCNNFSIVYYNKRPSESRDYQYFRFYAETSGNLMYLYCKATDKETNTAGNYETFNLPFAQYIKGEADFRYYDVISPKLTFVYRLFGGVSVPYLNSNGLPSVKKYYAGGANSMRAWESRSLGLGSYLDTTNSFKYYLGDIKLEMNLESRFHLFWLIDGAAFIDVGNIWSFRNDDLSGSQFHFSDFYKDLAVGTGFGLRFDFSFLIVRCDLGVKFRDAHTISNTNSHIIWGNRSLTSDDFNLNIGIGYPF